MNVSDYAKELLKTKKMSLYLEDDTGNISNVRRIKRKDVGGSPIFLAKEIYMNPKIGRECEPEIFRELNQLVKEGVLTTSTVFFRNYTEYFPKTDPVGSIAYYFINGKK